MNVGIDLISFYTPQYFLDLRVLARERGVDPDKFTISIGHVFTKCKGHVSRFDCAEKPASISGLTPLRCKTDRRILASLERVATGCRSDRSD